jgi:hypothetical protein
MTQEQKTKLIEQIEGILESLKEEKETTKDLFAIRMINYSLDNVRQALNTLGYKVTVNKVLCIAHIEEENK